MKPSIAIAILFFLSLAVALVSYDLTVKYYEPLSKFNLQDKPNYYNYAADKNCSDCASSWLFKTIAAPLTALEFYGFAFVFDFLILFIPALIIYTATKNIVDAASWFLSLASIFLFVLGLYSQFLVVVLFVFYLFCRPKSVYVKIALILLAGLTHQYGALLMVISIIVVEYLPKFIKNQDQATAILSLSAKALMLLSIAFLCGYSVFTANRMMVLFHPLLSPLQAYGMQGFQSLFLFIFWTAPVGLWIISKENKTDAGLLILLNVLLLAGIASLVFFHEIEFWRIVILIDILGLSVLAKSEQPFKLSKELMWLSLMQTIWIFGTIWYLLT